MSTLGHGGRVAAFQPHATVMPVAWKENDGSS
jgi:hypothetical protein